MKPEKAVKMSVDSDLSFTSATEVKGEVRERLCEFDKNFLLQESKNFYYLRVPSQLLSEAMIIAHKLELQVELDLSYDPDEWSLRGCFWDTARDKPEEIIEETWSSGA